jgi:hypothetical protein
MNVRKRGLALLMCICMIFTLLPFSVFAEDAENGSRGGTEGTAQPSVVYGTYDESGTTWTQKTGLTADGVPYENSATGANVKYSKTATPVEGQKDTYKITLKIESKTSSTAPGASAVVLVIDKSYSMNCCATCNNDTYYGNFNYLHSKNCSKGNGTKWDTVKYNDTRLKAAKDAAIEFATSYGATGTGRYISIVTFCEIANRVKLDKNTYWLDVSDSSNLAKVTKAINGIELNSATNLSDGLNKANENFKDNTVKNINSKYTVLLTDGEPNEPGGGSQPATAAVNSATNLKKACKLYTVCVGAENTKFNGTTVGAFLKDSIASTGSEKYAYNTSSRDELIKAFEDIFKSIEQGLSSGFTVTDPMGKYIQLDESSIKDATANVSDNTITWTPKAGTPTTNPDGSKTYTYTLTYKVMLGEVPDDGTYPLNKDTTLAFKDGDADKTLHFNVPGVQGTAPRYKVTYEFDGNYPDSVAVPASEQHKAGETVTMPEINAPEGWIFNGWKYDSKPVASVEMPASDITIIGTFTEQKAYTVKYLLNGTDISVKDAETGIKNVGESVSAVAPDLTGYTFAGTDADKNQTITVVSDASKNVITFYYYKNVTVTANDGTKVYGDNDPAAFGATVTGTRDNETVVYTVDRQAGEYVGNYAITPTGDEIQGYYKVEYKDGSFTITARPVTLTGESAIRTYTGQEIELTGITPDGLLDGHKLSGVSYSAKGTDARTEPYPGKFSNTENLVITDAAGKNVTNNYNVEYKPGALTINPIGTVTVTIKGNTDSKVYNGTEQSVTGYDVEISDPKYTRDDFKFTGNDKVYRTDVGTTYMGLKAEQFENKNSNFDKVTFVIENDGYVEVTKRTVTLTSETASKTYDGTPLTKPEVTVTGDGFVLGEVTDIKATGSVTNVSEGEVTNKITFVHGDAFNADNYNIETSEGKLSITPLAVTVTAKDYTKYVGEKDPAFEATVTGTINNDTVSYTISREKGETAGTYSITPAGAEAQGNYTVTYNAGTLTIKERPYIPPVNPPITDKITVEITGNSDSVVYDGAEHSVKDYTVKISDSRYTEKDFTFSGKALASGINAGTYEMGLKADQFKNTNARFKNVEFIIKADGVLTITQRPLTITAGSAEGIAPVTCDKYTVEGLATGDKVDSVKITGIQSEPGESPNVASDAVIKNAKGEDVTANYKITYVNGVLKAIEVLNKEIHFNYVIGYTDGTIRPSNDISRAEVATIFFRLLTDEARTQYTTTAGNFTDVKAGMWCNRAIATLTNMGIIKGYTDGSFQPNKSITRAELATIIARFAKLDVNTKTFSDINGHWAQKNIELAAGNGWINGYEDGTFRPNNNITRAETFAMINRVLDRQTESVSDLLPTSEMNMWSDNLNENAWYYKDVQEATNYHKCDRVGDSVYEKWTEKVPDIDWASYQI